ncbi:MAG: IPT/TIG domain-containing protein [Clostridia bacterium]|nr:IPT/TIG domain-containing protein [Clostridia bacterium]
MDKFRKLLILCSIVFMIVLFTGCDAKLSKVSPKSGAVGETITLKGHFFGDSAEDSKVFFGDVEAVISLWSKSEIKVKVPVGAETGEIYIVKDEKQSKSISFELIKEEYEVLFEKTVKPSDSEVTAGTEDISVTLPPGIISSDEQLTISKVLNAPGFSDEIYEQTDVFSITLGDKTAFNDAMVIEFSIDEKLDDCSYIRAAYWDEQSLEWVEAPSHVDMNNRIVRVYTDHLTNWRLFALKKMYSVYESKHFLVAYNRKEKADVDNVNTATSMESLAKQLGDILDESYSSYYNVLGVSNTPQFQLIAYEYIAATLNPRSWYSSTKEIVDTRAIVMLSSSYNKYGAEFGWISKHIKLPSKYKDSEDMKTTAAHELFHAFQNYKLNVMTMNNNRWLMEATAEYASYYVGNNLEIKTIHTYTRTDKNLQFYENRAGGQEYGMSSYIKYLVDNGSDFGTLWNTIISDSSSPTQGLDSYVKTLTGTGNDIRYKLFWQDVLTNSNRPAFSFVDIGVRAKSFGGKKVITIPMTIVNDLSMTAVWTEAKTYNSDGRKSFIVEIDGDLPDGVWIDVFKMSGFNRDTISYQRVDGGQKPVGSLNSSRDYLVVNFTEGNSEIMMITAYGNKAGKKVNVKVSDISLILKPSKIETTEPDKLYKFDATADNIPKMISDVTVSWELEDGTFLGSEDYKNKNGRIKGRLAYEFEENNIQNIIAKVTDKSTDKVIAEGKIQISKTDILTISVTPKTPEVNQKAEMKTQLISGLYYKWESGDGNSQEKIDLSKAEFSYSQPGRYQVKVSAYENSGMTVLKAFGTTVVEVQSVDVSPVPAETPEASSAALTRWLAFDKAEYLPGDRMTVKIESNHSVTSTYESVNHYKWSAKPADDKTAAMYKQATGKDILYTDKSGEPSTIAPDVPGTYLVTGVFIQEPDVTISGTFIVKEGNGGYWKRVDYSYPDPLSNDTTTTSSSDSRIKTRAVSKSTKTTFDLTNTTTYPDGKVETTTYIISWDDLPEKLIPGEEISFSYKSQTISDTTDTASTSGLGIYYDGWGNTKGLVSSTSSTDGKSSASPVIVVFKVPDYGSVGNAAKKLELLSGIGLKTEDKGMLIISNYFYAIYASYEYVE